MITMAHALTGALAGALSRSPAEAVVAGMASHAVLDVVPHWDHDNVAGLIAEGAAIAALLGPFASDGATGRRALVGAFSGILPDFEHLVLPEERSVFPSHRQSHRPARRGASLLVQGGLIIGAWLLIGMLCARSQPAGGGRSNRRRSPGPARPADVGGPDADL